MASLTLKNIPDELLRSLRARALTERRSLTQQVLHLLERALDETDDPREQAEAQIALWRELAGKWQATRSAGEEIGDIYDARTQGREVDL